MANTITQEAFEDLVKENMKDFEMQEQEAVSETLEQLKMQKINTVHIVQSLTKSESGDVLSPLILALQQLSSEDGCDLDKIASLLHTIKIECEINIAHRLLAAKNNAVIILAKVGSRLEQEGSPLFAVMLETLAELIEGQPDVIRSPVPDLLMKYIDKYEKDSVILSRLLVVIQRACVMHERNRQLFVEKGLIEFLIPLLDTKGHVEVVREVLNVIQTLTLDDDIREVVGMFTEHIKVMIVKHGMLHRLLVLLDFYLDNLDMATNVLITLSQVALREEYCQTVKAAGGIETTMKALVTHGDDVHFAEGCLVMLQTMASSDDVKDIVANKGIDVILSIVSQHCDNPKILEAGVLTLGIICLRQPCHSEKLMSNPCSVDVIADALGHFTDNVKVHRACSLAIRNIVARSPQFSKPFLEAGVEPLLRRGRTVEAKAALRDLGCHVRFEEVWKGTGGEIPQD